MVLDTESDELSKEQKKAILDERAAFLAQAPVAASKRENQLDILEVIISGEHFAFEARYVREASKLGTLTPLPNTPEFIVGLMNFRGQILPLLDLRKFLELTPKESSNTEKMVVVVQSDESQAGITVDEIVGINSITEASLQSPKQLVSGTLAPLLRGVKENMLAVLDVNALFNDPRIIVESHP